MRGDLGERVATALSAPEFSGPGHQRMLDVAQAVQLAVGLIALVAIWVLPGESNHDRLIVTALLLLVYAPYSFISRRTAAASRGPIARIANITIDVLAIGMFAIVIPDTRVAILFAYFLVIAFHAYVSGRYSALMLTGEIIVIAVIAEHQAPSAERLNTFTQVMFVAVLVALSIMVDALAVERRRAARHLARLQESMEQLGAAPDLDATVDAVAQAAQGAVGASFVAVLLNEESRLVARSIAGREAAEGEPDDEGQEAAARALQFPEASPSGVALSSGKPVVVHDFDTDGLFSHWAPEGHKYGFNGMVSIPFGPGGTPLGVLNAYFAPDRHFDQDDIDLLVAYSKQASLNIERALAYQREKEAAQHLKETDRIKSDFVATISHELRTPLTSISGFVSTVLLRWDQLDDTSKRELLERAAWNAGELRRMIEQVLSFSKLEAGSVQLRPLPLALAPEVEGVVEHMLPVLHAHHIDVSITPELTVMADTEGLHHILWNLLSNAVKFSPAGSTITVMASRQAGAAVVTVRDEGPGIRPEDQDKVFDRFYRSTSGATHARGTGIGLTVVRSYVERHGGKVWIESEPGQGSTFCFTLPLADEQAALDLTRLGGGA